MLKRFVIIHYNTPILTECLVRSINLFVEDAFIYIFDNSDKEPFTASFDNVFVFDNTHGKIIDFDKWLEKYPNRYKSHGKVNSWGSAKHCYSVEKCMELIEEPFILLDSDVLFKKDVSSLFDEEVIYCGETITQPKSTVKRILPFLCFINVPMCKKHNVHYFDEKKMHGLRYNGIGDRYDTGASFFLQASKFKHKNINLSDYIIHYGHGSWNKEEEKVKLSPIKWLNIQKKYWRNKMNKKVIYTCITGGYDELIEPECVTDGFDYVCFTDNENLENEVWEIRPLPKEVEGLSQVKKQRYLKINPHKVLSEYDISIWVDGNVEIRGDLDELLDRTLKDGTSVYVPKHPHRHCTYDEATAIIVIGKDKKENVNPQTERYRKEGFPRNYGLLQSNIMIRRHNEEGCIKLMETWFEEVKNGSHRDQLSFNYSSWKNQDVNVIYLDKNIYNSEWFHWKSDHKKVKIKIDNPKPIEEEKIDLNVLEEKIEKEENINRKIKFDTENLYTY